MLPFTFIISFCKAAQRLFDSQDSWLMKSSRGRRFFFRTSCAVSYWRASWRSSDAIIVALRFWCFYIRPITQAARTPPSRRRRLNGHDHGRLFRHSQYKIGGLGQIWGLNNCYWSISDDCSKAEKSAVRYPTPIHINQSLANKSCCEADKTLINHPKFLPSKDADF